MVRAAYIAMELTAWFVIVPLAFASLLTGIVQSLGTPWGLFRHYWVLAKLLLTVLATIVLLLKMELIGYMADVAAETTLSSADFRTLRIQLVVHAVGGLLVLLAAATLAVFKPWGMTSYGRRKQHEAGKMSRVEQRSRLDSNDDRVVLTPTTPRWMYVVGFHALGLVLLVVVLHIAGGGLRHH